MYVRELRALFTDAQITHWLDDYVADQMSPWRVSSPSHADEEDLQWVLNNVNTLLHTPRCGLTFYLVYRPG